MCGPRGTAGFFPIGEKVRGPYVFVLMSWILYGWKFDATVCTLFREFNFICSWKSSVFLVKFAIWKFSYLAYKPESLREFFPTIDLQWGKFALRDIREKFYKYAEIIFLATFYSRGNNFNFYCYLNCFSLRKFIFTRKILFVYILTNVSSFRFIIFENQIECL